eukprot:Colp12_sorted_trinity150504_noHs@16605
MAIDRKFLLNTVIVVATNVAFCLTMLQIAKMFEPMKKEKDASRKQGMEILKKRGVKDLTLNQYEWIIASNIVDPTDIEVTWEDIAGLDESVEELKETVVLPLTRPDIFQNSSALLKPPKGCLLYGPPGCGKTMLAKSVAKAADCVFINLQMSTLTEKWYGESQKLVAALFSLAQKLQPCIVFLDEADALFRDRQKTDHEVTSMMKNQFMALWDGLQSDNARIVFLCATNRPHDIDKAFLRRMPKTFHIGLPSLEQRMSLLRKFLQGEVVEEGFDYQRVAVATEGYSGSDLKELCRTAAMATVRDLLKMEAANRTPAADSDTPGEAKINLRPIRTADFIIKQEQTRTPQDLELFEDAIE